MAEMASLQVLLEAQTSKFAEGMTQATNSLNKLNANVKQNGQALSGLSAKFAEIGRSAMSLGGAASALYALKAAVSFSDQVVDLASAFDTSAESVLNLQGAFLSYGGKAEDVANALTKVAQATTDALNGNDAARKSFTDLGITMEQIVNKNADEVFLLLADAISKLPSKLEQAAVSTDMLGKSFKGMDIAGLSKELGTVTEKAGRLDAQLRAAAAGQDAWEKSLKFAKTTLASLVGEVALFLNLVESKQPQAVTKVIASNGEWIAANDKLKQSFSSIEEARARFNTISSQTPNFDGIKQSESVIKATAKATTDAAKEVENWNAVISRSVEAQISWESKMLDSLNPIRELERGVAQANIAFESGRFSADEWAAAVSKISETTFDPAKVVEPINSMEVAIGNLTSQGVRGLVDTIFEADQSFGKFAENFLKNIGKMILEQMMLNTVAALFKPAGGAAGGGGGGLGGIAGIIGALLPFAKGGAFGKGIGLPQGIYTQPTFFGMPGNGPLQKFAKGGVLGEAGPEAIMPLRRGKDGKLGVEGGNSAPVNITINNDNSANTKVEATETSNADGSRQIEIMVQKIVKEQFNSGSMDKSMRTNYGIMRSAA